MGLSAGLTVTCALVGQRNVAHHLENPAVGSSFVPGPEIDEHQASN